MASGESTRTEEDSLGEVEVPEGALYGSHTVRALRHRITDGRLPPGFIRAVAMVKLAAARANSELDAVDGRIAGAIEEAAGEIVDGEHDEQFPLGAYQTGSGTSTNMNVNEVIANRSAQILGLPVGKNEVHPNDDVNASQSSNDVIPTAIHLSVLLAARDRLFPALRSLREALDELSSGTEDVVKPGRTHLQDAAPVTLGQELSGHSTQVSASMEACLRNLDELKGVALGGTAVGTGLNCPEGFTERALKHLRVETGLELREAGNHFAAQAAHDALLEVSGSFRRTASSLMKIANDLRLLVSGPRTAIGELRQPRDQPGSSIMPGKINPVVPEAVVQAASQVHGLDAAVSVPGAGELELNLMKPLMAANLLREIGLLAGAAGALAGFVRGLEPDVERCSEMAEMTLALATALNPVFGYEEAAEIAREAHRDGRTVLEVVVERGIMGEEEAAELLDPSSMT
ncbi:MAG: Fumarate hydratase class II [Methanonatronarchaeales archaeon]|nr:Fumarate hydratase class II [Methanonatronarchaeales archaeon]